MVTWPIFLALIFAYFAVKYTIKMEEEAEFLAEEKIKEQEEAKKEQVEINSNRKDTLE